MSSFDLLCRWKDINKFKRLFYFIISVLEVTFLLVGISGSSNCSKQVEYCLAENGEMSRDISQNTLPVLDEKIVFNTNTVLNPTPMPILPDEAHAVHTPLPTSAETDAPQPVVTPVPADAPIQSSQDTVENKKQILYPVSWGNKERREAALTFDDGLDGKALAAALETLRKTNVKCTFFIIGEALGRHANLYKQAVQDGHQICNHTKMHKYLTGNLSDDAIKQELLGWENDVKAVLGDEYLARMKKEFPYMRLPGGCGGSDKRILDIIAQNGYIPVGWSDETVFSVLRYHNINTETVDPIARQIAIHISGNAQNGSIILLHFNAFDVCKLEDTIKGITDKGLALKLVSEVIR